MPNCGLSTNCHSAVTEERAPGNRLNLARGAELVSAQINPAGALALTDGDPASAWNTFTTRNPPPYRFGFELIAPRVTSEIGIIGAGVRPGGVTGLEPGSFCAL